MFRTSVSGCLVTVNPKVMNFPASPINDFKIGNEFRFGLSSSATSVTGPEPTYFGPYSANSESLGSILSLFNIPDGIFIFVRFIIRPPISLKSLDSRAICNLSIVPKALPKTGMLEPSTFSNNTAG